MLSLLKPGVGGTGLGAASHKAPRSRAHVARAGTWALWAHSDYVAGGAGSAAPGWGLFMAVSGSPTVLQVEVREPPEAGSAEFEVRLGSE